ncbi:MAG: hypothetical protein AB7E47_02245 [Desulfovibrionaceae bacterium]
MSFADDFKKLLETALDADHFQNPSRLASTIGLEPSTIMRLLKGTSASRLDTLGKVIDAVGGRLVLGDRIAQAVGRSKRTGKRPIADVTAREFLAAVQEAVADLTGEEYAVRGQIAFQGDKVCEVTLRIAPNDYIHWPAQKIDDALHDSHLHEPSAPFRKDK